MFTLVVLLAAKCGNEIKIIMENMIDYLIEYEKFQNDFHIAQISGEEIGVAIMHMATYFARYNLKLGEAIRKFSAVKANFQNQVDPTTGKSMSSSKAELLADDTPEAYEYEMARIHINNIQEFINALKALQRGILNEYANTN